MKFFNKKAFKKIIKRSKKDSNKDNGKNTDEALKKYKAFIESKKDILIKLHMEKVERYSALHEAFIRSTRLISGAEYPKDKQEKDLSTIEKSLFCFESKIVYEALTLMSSKVAELHRLIKDRAAISNAFQIGYMEQLNTVRGILKRDMTNDSNLFKMINLKVRVD